MPGVGIHWPDMGGYEKKGALIDPQIVGFPSHKDPIPSPPPPPLNSGFQFDGSMAPAVTRFFLTSLSHSS